MKEIEWVFDIEEEFDCEHDWIVLKNNWLYTEKKCLNCGKVNLVRKGYG